MIKKALILYLLTTCVLVSGCTVLVGKALYDSGELTRVYPATFDDSVEACVETLESLDMIHIDTIPHGITTEIRAEWSDGTPVAVVVVMVSNKITEISIRSGIIGVRDRNVCEMIHENIAKRLQG